MSKLVAERTYRMTDENDNLVISYVVSKQDKSTALLAFEETKKVERLEVEVKQYKSKRSLEQNRMLWALLGRMADLIEAVLNKLVSLGVYDSEIELISKECGV